MTERMAMVTGCVDVSCWIPGKLRDEGYYYTGLIQGPSVSPVRPSVRPFVHLTSCPLLAVRCSDRLKRNGEMERVVWAL